MLDLLTIESAKNAFSKASGAYKYCGKMLPFIQTCSDTQLLITGLVLLTCIFQK